MSLTTRYLPTGPKATLACRLSEYTTDDIQTMAFPGAIAAAYVTAEVDVTSSTALVAVTGLSIPNLVAGGVYAVECYLPGTSGASGGVKVSLDTSDTLTATSISLTAQLNAAAATSTVTATALATGVGATAAVIQTVIDAVIVVNVGGTLIVKFAQNASNATPSSVYVNGYLKVTRIA